MDAEVFELGELQPSSDPLVASVDEALRGYAAARAGTRQGIEQSGMLALVETVEQAALVMRQAVRILEANLASLPAHSQKACGAGCAWCCRQRVDVAPLEALAIAGFVRSNLLPGAKGHALPRLRENAARIAGLTQAEHARSAIRCAFLDEHEGCQIHPVRPLACVGWHSFSRAQCEAFYQIGNPAADGVKADMATNVQARGFQAGLADAARSLGRDGSFYELHAAVTRALDAPRVAADWAAGRASFDGCTPGAVAGDVVLRHRRADGAIALVAWTEDAGFRLQIIPAATGAAAGPPREPGPAHYREAGATPP